MTRKNRRDFLKGAAAAGIGFWAGGGVSGRSRAALANDEINFACIGVFGKGQSDTASANKHGNVVAICDIDDKILGNSAKAYPKAKKFNDFREMLDKFGKSIDAVTVSTPDHCHAVAAIQAMKMGKHCFCQKPLTHSISEARMMAKIASEMKVATQMGNQFTASRALRKSSAVIKSGILGKVIEVHVWTNRPVWAQGGPRPKPAANGAPKHVKWDLWLGPAPYRPFANGYHRFSWRGYWDFGTGALGDMACHTLNLPYMALDLKNPISVEAESSGHNKDSYPKKTRIVFEFPATDSRPALTLYWYDGGNRPEAELLKGVKGNTSTGSLMVGDKGSFFSPGDYAGDYNNSGVLADGGYTTLKDFKGSKYDFPKSPGHFTEFANAIKGGEPAMSNFPGYSGGLTETILLGNLAVWAGVKVKWDAEKMIPTGAPGLDRIVKREYRKGYTL